MKGKRIATFFYVLVLALGITSLILIRPKPPKSECAFKFKYRGEKFKPTDEVKFLSAKNYFKVEIRNYNVIGFMILDAKAKCTISDFFNAVAEEAMKAGADYVQLTGVKRHMVTHAYGWAIGTTLAGGGGSSIGRQEEIIEKRFIYYFTLYRKKEAPKWPSE